jgi:hypothetical protein
LKEGRQVHVITAAKLKWQPHTTDVLTEGALKFTTQCTAASIYRPPSSFADLLMATRLLTTPGNPS